MWPYSAPQPIAGFEGVCRGGNRKKEIGEGGRDGNRKKMGMEEEGGEGRRKGGNKNGERLGPFLTKS